MEHIEFAYCLNGPEAGQRIDHEDHIVARLRADELAWVHLVADHPETDPWMEEVLDFVEAPTRAALTAKSTRPRSSVQEDGLVVILRGVNLNPGEEVEDMVSLRVFLNPARIITLSRRRLKSLTEMQEAVEAGEGPQSVGGFLTGVVERMGGRIDEVLFELAERVDVLEDAVIASPDPAQRSQVVDERQEVIDLRRYLGPQRDAIGQLTSGGHPMLTKHDRRRLAEAHDRLVRGVEELDAMRDRLIVLKDEIDSAVQDKLNRNLYLLSILSAIFLPLGFLTGLMGINLGGMPGAESPWAFWAFTGGLVVVGILQVWVLRRLRWI
ncbi:zinc transporter ZntB [Vannielia litorea]|uniref:zinc transporter ZntB n=1 Tax=Vannielia litorea TaxID=1217970 RepID=UPI001C96989D|nr:zinc transporter ZntB [Vannielia litorea]MBY6046011.1 zinc transporter ZntB [Vannielia litorea]MBY6073424.1 zinc transporter ZntB [Vannielia litorea]